MGRRKENRQRVDLHKDFSFIDKHPVKYSLAIGVIWIVIGFGISILGYFVNHRGYLWNLNAGMVVDMIVTAIWALVKIGVLESFFFKLQNYRDRNFSQKYNVTIKRETKDSFIARRREKSWWGISLLAGISLMIFIITTTIQFI